ncbi:ABC transporter permease subunit [Micromonospora sp. BQ11]|uniref:ABC transporter permease subunit n=1 Tax=Micromonospora sp. BQ11 TaxID=3452212 RepID=UPI003F89F12A
MTTTTAPTRPAPAAPPRTTGVLTGAVAAEWTKIWSVRSTWWALLGGALLMAATAGQLAIYAANANTDDNPANDLGVLPVTDVVVDAVGLTQFAVLALGLLAVTSEFTTGTIRTTMQCTPSRGRVLLAKALVTAAVTVPAGLLLGGIGVLVAGPVLGRWGTVPPAATVGDLVAVAVYLALVGVLALGLAAVLRSAVLTLIVLFLTLSVVPSALRELDVTALDRIADALPGEAGGHFLTGGGDPYPPAVGLALLTAWTVAALLAGRAALRRRDA